MFFQLSNAELAGWCRRVGLSINAGLDIIRVLKREGERGSGRMSAAKCWRKVAESVQKGDSLYEALLLQKEQLNDLFISLVKVGEMSGSLGETLLELADYYDQLTELRKSFLRSLIMPIFELCTALTVVGVVILILGFLPIGADITGFGLVGVSGFIKYICFLVVIAGLGVATYWFAKTHVVQFQLVHYIINYIPKIGPIFRTLAMTRLCWSLFLTMRTGMDVKEALALSFNAASYGPITGKLPIMYAELEQGGNLHDAFRACRFFDDMMIFHVETGEEAGELPEVMERLAKEYFAQSVARLKTLSVIGFFVVFFFVAGIIIFFIFRLAMFYIGILNDAATM
ncbi:MAG: type II secretion system F family protein [Thermoguttaceae bacterium]